VYPSLLDTVASTAESACNGHVDGRVHMHHLPGEDMTPGSMGRRPASSSSVTLWEMFCKETLGPAIQTDVTSMLITQPVVETCPDGRGLFQQENTLKNVQEWFKGHNKFKVMTWLLIFSDYNPI